MVGVTNTVEIWKYSGILRYSRYSQETLQYKNIPKYKSQMIYFRNYTGTPSHLLAQFLQNP